MSINERYQAALVELDTLEKDTKQLLEQLEGGVELSLGYAIVDRYWEGAMAADMKVRMSAVFPKENSDIIRNAPFTRQLSRGVGMEQTFAYLDEVFTAIIAEVERVYAIINAHDIYDQEAIMKLNEFRKEPARFIDFVRAGWYDGREKVADDEIITWETLRAEQDTSLIESGSYLFLTDYSHELRKAKEQMEEDLTRYNNPDDYHLYDVEHSVRRIRSAVKLTSLFYDYLMTHTDEVTA